MADDGTGEKTEKATPKKLQDERKKGQVAQSQDIPKLFILMGLGEITLDLSSSSLKHFTAMLRAPVQNMNGSFSHALDAVMTTLVHNVLYFMLITAAVAVILRLAGGWVQFGFLFSTESLKPNFKKLDPVTNLKEKFSSKALITMLLNIVKVMFIACIVYIMLRPLIPGVFNLTHTSVYGFWFGSMSVFRHVLYATFAILILLSFADLKIQRALFAKKMKMSIQDVKREMKDTNGNPETLYAQSRFRQEILNTPPPVKKEKVDNADMVVVNPTHVAVALSYKPEEIPLPVIVGKGEEQGALEMIAEAKKKDIPVLQCIRIARAIYPANIGETIPRDTLRGVATLYKILRELEESLGDEIYEVPDKLVD